jgi:non-ribosomal peptide synthetase component E (peptide arylation enzyme)
VCISARRRFFTLRIRRKPVACQVTIPKFSPRSFCETVERERVSHTVLVPTMINLLTQFPELKEYDSTPR